MKGIFKAGFSNVIERYKKLPEFTGRGRKITAEQYHHAVFVGDVKLTLAYIKANRNNPDAISIQDAENGCTALHYAVKKPNEKIIAALLAANIDRSIKDAEGNTAADMAKLLGNQGLVNCLESNGVTFSRK